MKSRPNCKAEEFKSNDDFENSVSNTEVNIDEISYNETGDDDDHAVGDVVADDSCSMVFDEVRSTDAKEIFHDDQISEVGHRSGWHFGIILTAPAIVFIALNILFKLYADSCT